MRTWKEQEKTLNEYLDMFNTKAEGARAIGVAPQALQNWYYRKNIPMKFAVRIEAITKGKIKASQLNNNFFKETY